MSWNINDWTDDKNVWDEPETDDEFDDNQLARLGIELPKCAREPRPTSSRTPNWDTLIDNLSSSPEIQAALASVYDRTTGSFRFGDDPDPMGINPITAGFDMVPEDFNPPHNPPPLTITVNGEPLEATCVFCGHNFDGCHCGEEDDEDDYDPTYCYDHDCPRQSCSCDDDDDYYDQFNDEDDNEYTGNA
jgi:hypothetical protein